MVNTDILVFGPHPDDVELFVGGYVASCAYRNQKVVIVDLSEGELATNGSVETRRQEANIAAQTLGVDERVNLALPDGNLGTDPGQLKTVVECIRKYRPRQVLAPYLKSRHPDHRNSGELIRDACFWANVKGYKVPGERHQVEVLLHYPMRVEITPKFVVDISKFYELKQAAISCYKSQIKGTEPTLLTSELSSRGITTRDASYGALIGVEYGEPFWCSSPLRVDNPLEHFAANPVSAAVSFRGEES